MKEKRGSEDDFESNGTHFTTAGPGNLWNAETNVLTGRALTYQSEKHT
jgi:hypothetical protein